jgi:hypothetical protein
MIMADKNERLRKALLQIESLARAAVGGEELDSDAGYDAHAYSGRHCVPKTLPNRLLVRAARNAMRISAVNAPAVGRVAEVNGREIGGPARIAVTVTKYWGPKPRRLSVSFMESTPSDLRQRIVGHLNAWSKTAGITFAQTQSTGEIRISRGPGGYWSYLGTDVLLIPKNRPTMNLESFTMSTSEAEYRRVVRHEAGHTLGFPHEHMRKELVARIDPDKAYEWFLETYGWDQETVDAQVLTPLDDASIYGTPTDQTSIMCYQLPGDITHDSGPIVGGDDINSTDYQFAAEIYPRADATSQGEHGSKRRGMNGGAEDWPASEDVQQVEA